MSAASWLEGLPAPDRWRARLLADGPRLATWLLALAIGVQAAFIVTDLAGAGSPARARAGVPRQFHARSTDVAAITNAHLFGTAPVARQDDANAQPTNIPLVLTGIISGNDPLSGLAILGPTAQTAKVHAVGDAISGGVKLHSVYSDRVIIDRNGQLESLALPHQVSGTAPAPSAASLPTQSPVIERMRRALTEQPGLLADLLHPQAVIEDGKVKGFRLFPGRNRLAFARLGLRPGDEVVAINGTPLDDQERGQAILNTLPNSSEARVTLIRNNQQQDIVLNIAQVAQEAESATGIGSGAGNGGLPTMPNSGMGGPFMPGNVPPGTAAGTAPVGTPADAPPPPQQPPPEPPGAPETTQ
jgi:general secretion pathway protein C